MEKALTQFDLARNSFEFAESDERNEHHEHEQRQSQDCLQCASTQIGNALGEGLSMIEANDLLKF